MMETERTIIKAALAPGSLSQCRSCGAHVIWVITNRRKLMPVDWLPVAEGLVEVEGVLFTSHFATCPDAEKWRKK